MNAVLIVDGHQEFRHTTRAILECRGLEAMCAVDADHALKKLDQRVFSAAVIGASLTDTTGLTFVRRIRLAAPSLPVIVVTEHPSPEAARAYRALGAHSYLPKAEFLKIAPEAVANAVDTYGEVGKCTSSLPAAGA